MAPKKRQSGPSAARNQSTLTFNGRSNKITKPSAQAPSTKAKKLDADSIPTPPTTSQVDVAELADTTSERVVLEQAQKEAEAAVIEKTPEELEAEKITEAQIKKYWRGKEQVGEHSGMCSVQRLTQCRCARLSGYTKTTCPCMNGSSANLTLAHSMARRLASRERRGGSVRKS